MNQSPRPAIAALAKVCGLSGKEIGAGHIGFGFGPRLNAAGHLLGDAMRALRLLLCTEKKQALIMAAELDKEDKARAANRAGHGR